MNLPSRIILGVVVLLVVSLAISIHNHHKPPLEYEVVTTPEDMARGLSGRDHLEPNHGMLFKWSDHGNRCMWAKDMKFDVDVFFLDDDGTALWKATMKAGTINPVCSPDPVRYVLETNAGEIK